MTWSTIHHYWSWFWYTVHRVLVHYPSLLVLVQVYSTPCPGPLSIITGPGSGIQYTVSWSIIHHYWSWFWYTVHRVLVHYPSLLVLVQVYSTPCPGPLSIITGPGPLSSITCLDSIVSSTPRVCIAMLHSAARPHTVSSTHNVCIVMPYAVPACLLGDAVCIHRVFVWLCCMHSPCVCLAMLHAFTACLFGYAVCIHQVFAGRCCMHSPSVCWAMLYSVALSQCPLLHGRRSKSPASE